MTREALERRAEWSARAAVALILLCSLAVGAVGFVWPSRSSADVEFRAPGGTNGARIYKVVRTFSIVEVTSLFTTPIEILPARSGYVYAADMAIFLRAGQRYATWPGNMQIRTTGQASLLHFTASAGTIGTNTTTTGGVNGAAAFGVTMSTAGGAGDEAGSFGSKGVEVTVATGNPTVDVTNTGAPITIVYYYRVLPTNVSKLGPE